MPVRKLNVAKGLVAFGAGVTSLITNSIGASFNKSSLRLKVPSVCTLTAGRYAVLVVKSIEATSAWAWILFEIIISAIALIEYFTQETRRFFLLGEEKISWLFPQIYKIVNNYYSIKFNYIYKFALPHNINDNS